MAFKYRSRDEKTIKDRANQTGGAFDTYFKSNIPRYKVKDTENNLRILPPTWSDTQKWGDNFGIDIFVHYGVGADDATYLCPAKMGDDDCCICDSRAERTTPLEEGEQDELKPGRRVAVYVIDRDDEKAGPQVWAMPWTLERDIQELSIDKELGVLHIDHPDEGYDISFSRQGKNRNIKYVGVKIARRSSPIHDRPKQQEEWLDFIQDNPLPDILHIHDNEYLKKIFRGQISHRADAIDDGATTSDRGGSRRSADERGGDSSRPSRRASSNGDDRRRGKGDLDPLKLADVEDMAEADLKTVIKDYGLDLDADNFERVSKLRAAVIDLLEKDKLLDDGDKGDNGGSKNGSSDRDSGRSAKNGADKDKDALVTTAQLDDMDTVALTKLIKQHRLNVNPDDFRRESKLREAVEDELKAQGLLDEGDSKGDKDATGSEARSRLENLKNERERGERSRSPERPSRTSRR